jgi:dTDP-4-dehydrorhamnose 3,5-epimerase
MILIKTQPRGAFQIVEKRIEDERGFFRRSFCANEFKEQGLNTHTAQSSVSSPFN